MQNIGTLVACFGSLLTVGQLPGCWVKKSDFCMNLFAQCCADRAV